MSIPGLIEEHVGTELKGLVSITAAKEIKRNQFRLLNTPIKTEELDEEADIQVGEGLKKPVYDIYIFYV
jgi:hypothetical protein